MSRIEQDVQGPGAAVDRSCRGEGQHLCRAAQGTVDQLPQHRSLRTGAQPFAVDDAQAAGIALQGREQELVQLQFRLGGGEAMQIQLRLDAVLTATQFAQRARGDTGSGE